VTSGGDPLLRRGPGSHATVDAACSRQRRLITPASSRATHRPCPYSSPFSGAFFSASRFFKIRFILALQNRVRAGRRVKLARLGFARDELRLIPLVVNVSDLGLIENIFNQVGRNERKAFAVAEDDIARAARLAEPMRPVH